MKNRRFTPLIKSHVPKSFNIINKREREEKPKPKDHQARKNKRTLCNNLHIYIKLNKE
jgi:hypothetical protein